MQLSQISKFFVCYMHGSMHFVTNCVHFQNRPNEKMCVYRNWVKRSKLKQKIKINLFWYFHPRVIIYYNITLFSK